MGLKRTNMYFSCYVHGAGREGKNLDRRRQQTDAVCLSINLKLAISESTVSIGLKNIT